MSAALPRALMALTAFAVAVAACSRRSPARSASGSPAVTVSSPAIALSPSTDAGADADGNDAAVAGARTLIPREGVPRAWWSVPWDDVARDLAYTVRPRWFPRGVLLLGIGGGSAAAEFTSDSMGVPVPEVIVVEPDPAIRAQAAALGLGHGAKVVAGEEAIPSGATFDVILVDIQDDRSPYLASLDAAKADHVRQLLNHDGLLLLRRIARPSDPQLAVAARLFAAGLPFQRLVGSRLDGAEQDLLLVFSRKPIDGAFVYDGNSTPRVELPPPTGWGPERDLAAVRQAAEQDGEVETRVGYVRYDRDQLGIEGPCPEDASPDAWLTGPGARELAPRSSDEGSHYASRMPDDQDTVVALLGMGGSDDCTTILSHLAAAVQGTLSDTGLLSVSNVLFAVDSAQWKSLRRAVVAPRMTAAAAAIRRGDDAAAEKSLFAAMSDLEARLGPAVRSTRAFDAILAMREILLAHAAGPSPRGCADMLAQADGYFVRTKSSLRDSLEDPEGLRSGEPLDALKIRAAFGRCAGVLR